MIQVRPAVNGDLNACILLDGSYQTDHVWQMDRREDDPALSVSVRTVALPRVITVAYPEMDTALLAQRLQQGDCLLIAELEGKFIGFLDMSPLYEQSLGWIRHLVVGRTYRRHGVGSALLHQAAHWAAEHGLDRMLFVIQSKNYPAMQFCQKHGFEFCGFNELHFSNRDIALFFGHDLH